MHSGYNRLDGVSRKVSLKCGGNFSPLGSKMKQETTYVAISLIACRFRLRSSIFDVRKEWGLRSDLIKSLRKMFSSFTFILLHCPLHQWHHRGKARHGDIVFILWPKQNILTYMSVHQRSRLPSTQLQNTKKGQNSHMFTGKHGVKVDCISGSVQLTCYVVRDCSPG